jgi:hypothetical protein
MKVRILIAALLAIIGSNVVLAADEPVTVLYQDNPAIVTYEQLNP